MANFILVLKILTSLFLTWGGLMFGTMAFKKTEDKVYFWSNSFGSIFMILAICFTWGLM